MTLGIPLDIVTAVIGTALCGSGLYGVLQPLSMARAFGLVDPTPESVIFYPGLAGRNLATGVAIWWLKYLDQRRALGVLIICLLFNGSSDTYLLLKHWGEIDSVALHLFNMCVAGSTGAVLLWGN
ncbi:hypothetical protein CC79DRAFT_1372427 [Sarocladium strictum]